MAYPKLVTVAIIKNKNKVLLIKRANEPETGKWALPGGTGGFEKFLNPKYAIKDEVRYDLNIDFSINSFFKYYFREDSDNAVLSLVFTGEINKEPKINKKSVLECKYFIENEIKDLELAFEHKTILQDYFLDLKLKK